LQRQNRIVHLVKLREGLLLVELAEGWIFHEVRRASGKPLDGCIATGNQAMLIAATPDDQIRLKKGGHGRKATGQGNAKPFLFDSVNLQTEPPIVDNKRDGMPIVTR
jgi:hypothetical protein